MHPLVWPEVSPLWVVFDLGGVVIDLDPQLTFAGFCRHHQGQESLAWQHLTPAVFDYETGKTHCAEFRSQIRKILHAPNLPDQALDDSWNAMLGQIAPERIRTVRALRQNVRVAVLSNTNPIHIEAFAKRYLQAAGGAFEEDFDEVFLSHELGLRKPDRAIFEALLQQLQVPASRILYLDDTEEHLRSAASLGIKTWLIEHPDRWSPLFAEQCRRMP